MKSAEIEKLRERSIAKLDNVAALEHIGKLIDASFDVGFERGADRALHLLDELAKRNLTAEHAVLVQYFRANAWSVKEEVDDEGREWDWEHPYHEQQILALSRAMSSPGFVDIDDLRRCQILTNWANQLNTMGRFIDAIEGWDAALKIIPKFAMAQINRGYGLKNYGGLLEQDRQRAIFLLHAYDGLIAASAPDAIFDSMYPDAMQQRIADDAKFFSMVADLDRIRLIQDLNGQSLGRSRAERAYRQWCIDNRLFLNPINDLGPHSTASSDDLVLPPITERFEERPGSIAPPPIVGFFNQMKQEYASARFMLHDGLLRTDLHFSDRNVWMFDTLDYPLHSLATERIRTAYRIAYSLLDKVAFSIDHYWKLGKVADRINFKNVWMVEGKARLLDDLKSYANWPLRGLYWLSKELFNDQLRETTSADARELHDIRNALEHRYLQVHEGWSRTFMSFTPSSQGLGLSIDSELLEAKALRVMKIARSALIHLALAIGVEERKRSEASPETRLLMTMPLFSLNDRRKRRDRS